MSAQHITTVLIDLDGTLLPMDRDRFMEAYVHLFVKKCEDLDLPPSRSLTGFGHGVRAMLDNDGTMSNEERFWEAFCSTIGEDIGEKKAMFLEFYRNEFTLLEQVVSSDANARLLVLALRKLGHRVVLATSPLFPREGTLERIRWARLEPSWFELITTYEEFCYAKPSLGYYRQVLEKIGVQASECLMIGNDVSEDMVAMSLGMETFLVTDWLINTDNRDTSMYRQGTLAEAVTFCTGLGPAGSAS